MEKIGSQVQNVVLTLLRFYQRWISVMFPPRCRFIPTCSSYTMEAVEVFGIWRGLWLGATRLMRCHPLNKGGYDPIPQDTRACDCQSHANVQTQGND